MPVDALWTQKVQNMPMIARIWRGRVRPGLGHEYTAFLRERAIPDYRSIPGNLGAWVLAAGSTENNATEIITLSFWDSLDSIASFAGSDITIAKYYPEDQKYLMDFPERVEHYDLFER